jgi:hypothetical protein
MARAYLDAVNGDILVDDLLDDAVDVHGHLLHNDSLHREWHLRAIDNTELNLQNACMNPLEPMVHIDGSCTGTHIYS